MITKNLVIVYSHHYIAIIDTYQTALKIIFGIIAWSTYFYCVAKQKIKTERIDMKVAPEFKKRVEISAQECDTSVNGFLEVAAVEKMDRMDTDKLKGWLDS